MPLEPLPPLPLGIILFSGDFARAHYALMMANAALATDRPVVLFATMDGIGTFTRNGWQSLPGAEADATLRDRGVAGLAELLEAAFATCLTMTVQMYASKYGFPLQAARCEVRINRSVPDTVTLSYHLSFDGPLTDEQTARLREAASRCPVARTLSGAIALRPVLQEVGT